MIYNDDWSFCHAGVNASSKAAAFTAGYNFTAGLIETVFTD